MTKQFFKVLSLAAFISFSSCGDFFDLESIQPIDAVPADVAISDLQSAQAARAGVYSSLQTSNFDRWLAAPQYFSDEAVWTGTFPTRAEFDDYNVITSNGTMATMFTSFYGTINDANNILEILPSVEDATVDEESRNSILAEARFARAISYLELTQGWGDVPLIVMPTRGVGEELNVAKSSRDQVLAQVIEDMTFAAANLVDGKSLGATVAAANGYLARVALYQERWGDAETFAKAALGGGSLADFKAANANDKLFFIEFSSTDGNSLAFFYGPADLNGRLSISPSAELVAAFEEGDLRKALTVDTLNGAPYGVKYPDFNAASGSQASPIKLMRGSEMALIIAEADAEQGNFDDASDWINQVRSAAGLDDITLDGGSFEDAILQERFVELALEGGHRLWDVRRRGKAVEIFGPGGYDAGCDDIWPLPQREIDRNTALVQNGCCNC